MRELDALDPREATFLAELEALPGSYDGPDGHLPGPYGLTVFGEATDLPDLVDDWIDAPLVPTGTQFLVGAGFDFGEFGPLKLTSELTDARVVTLGGTALEPSLQVPAGPLSLYTFAVYLAHATGHGEAVSAIDGTMRAMAERCSPRVPTELNPAKVLAWTLWNRVPLLLAGREHAGVTALVQRVFARTGKSLAIAVGRHPLELVTGALEGNHAFGDDLLALLIGPDDPELALVREVVSSRVPQVETLDVPGFAGVAEPAGPASRLALWYAATWVAAYVAVLHGQEPGDSGVYLEARKAAESG